MTPFRPDATHWQVLPHLTLTRLVHRRPDGGITSLPGPHAAHCLAYGPHWWLRSGIYRLAFRADVARIRLSGQPSLALEIIAQNRMRACWRDFTASELSQPCTVDFSVPETMGAGTGEESRFEFKFFHLDNGTITLADVTLERIGDGIAPATPSLWRHLGSLHKSWAARRRPDGAVTVPSFSPARRLLRGGQPYLRLASGPYRLQWHGQCDAPDGKPALRVDIVGRSHWRRLRARIDALLGRPGSTETIATRILTPAEVARGEMPFAVPPDMGIDQGEDAPFEVRITRLAPIALRLDDLRLERLEKKPAMTAAPRGAARRKSIVVVGNCQADIVCSGFRLTESLNRRFAVKYHFVNLQENLLDAARADLDGADLVLAQDISDWADYPLRGHIRDTVPVIRFPVLAFASPWPFDHYNGPGDKLAMSREWPNLTFTYLDGLLARLRQEIPDPEERFRVYAALDWPGILNYRRRHDLEARRLQTMDAAFGGDIGAFVLDNFRKRQLFYTTNHPNGEILALLLRQILRRMDDTPTGITARPLDALHPMQVPVHPKVAADLGMTWVRPDTRYSFRGEQIGWEAYIRRYIALYG